MKNIALIGAGQLGRRHLQSLAKIEVPVKIDVIDSNLSSLRTAQQRFLEVPLNDCVHSISFSDALPSYAGTFDVCIVATSSNVRFDVVNEVLKSHHVKRFVLEKILFQRVEDYSEIEEKLISSKIKCWVNCPRRMVGFYKTIRGLLGNAPFEFELSGGDWGLGCNAIHFIDLIAMLTKDCNYELDLSGLDRQVIPSPRKGFKEFTGVIKGRFDQGCVFTIESMAGSDHPIEIKFCSKQVEIEISEAQGVAVVKRKGLSPEIEKRSFSIPFQSNITHLVVQDILEKDDCELTPYQDSAALHLQFIRAINQFLNIKESDPCPIT